MALLIKNLNGLAYASVKSRNGLAVASIKNINGLDATSAAGYAYLVSAGKFTGSPATTAAIDTTGANFIVVAIAHLGTPTLSDSKGNTWTPLTSYGTGDKIRLYYAYSPIVGSGHTFTGGGNFPGIIAAAFSGASASPFDQENGANGQNPGSITPSQANTLGITAISYYGGSPSVNSSYIPIILGPSLDNLDCAMAYKLLPTTAATNPVWSGAGDVPGCTVANFK